jgi:hypothetical protein
VPPVFFLSSVPYYDFLASHVGIRPATPGHGPSCRDVHGDTWPAKPLTLRARIPQASFDALAYAVTLELSEGTPSPAPLQKTAKFTLIRLPLLTGHPSICPQKAGVLRPFCAQVFRLRIERVFNPENKNR